MSGPPGFGGFTARSTTTAPITFDPEVVPELVEYWIPGVGESNVGLGSFIWAGQKGVANITQASAPIQPNPTTEVNGARSWEFIPATSDRMGVVAPTPLALQTTSETYFAFWFGPNLLDTLFQTVFDQGIAGGNARLLFRKRNAPTLWQVQYSGDGTTFGDSRWALTLATTQRYFGEIVVNPSGTSPDDRVQLWIDRVQQQASSHPVSPPTQLFPGTGALTLGNNSAGTSDFNGRLGPFFIASPTPSDSHRDGIATVGRLKTLPRQTGANRLVLHGDSRTLGTGASGELSYPNQLANILGSSWRVFNRGTGGLSTQNLLDEFPTVVAPLYTSSASTNAVLMFAWRNGVPATTVAEEQARISTYVSAAVSAGFQVWLGTSPPTTDFYAQAIEEINAWVRANWVSIGATKVVDFGADPRWSPAGNASYYADGVHPNGSGYGIIATAVADAIRV